MDENKDKMKEKLPEDVVQPSSNVSSSLSGDPSPEDALSNPTPPNADDAVDPEEQDPEQLLALANVRDQSEVERDIHQLAEKTLLEETVEREEKRLAKAKTDKEYVNSQDLIIH
jgi:hypothetical protein